MADKDTKPAFSKFIKQGRKRTPVSQQSSSGAPEPAAIDSAVQFDNDDDRKLRRIIKAPLAGNKLAKRSHEHRGLGDALHPFASTSPKLADHQKEPSASSSAKKLVEDVQQVGRSPTRAQAASPGEEEDACGAPQPVASSYDPWTGAEMIAYRKNRDPAPCGIEIHPVYQRILEEQAARSARSRRKAIEDFHWFSGF